MVVVQGMFVTYPKQRAEIEGVMVHVMSLLS